MSLPEIFRRLARLLALVVLVFSGSFVVIYLLRWEWNRALTAGVFFIAAELFLATDLLLRRIAAVEERLGDAEQREDVASLAAMLRRHRPRTPGPFAWLTSDRDQTFVLVPILLGAGIILSGVAFLVERLSRVAAAPVAEHELARGLAGMALPRGGLSPTGQPPVERPPRRSTARRNGAVIAVLFVSMMVIIFTMVFALLTRPAEPQPSRALVVELAVQRRDLEQSDVAVAQALWSICRVRIPQQVELQDLGAAGPGVYRMVIAPAPALFDTREFRGCLNDGLLDRASAQVLSLDLISQP